MKTNAIVRIILFSIAILVLAGILITGLAMDHFMFNAGSLSNSGSTLPMAFDGQTTVSVADASEVQNLQIEWAAGSIHILRDENAVNITVTESYPDGDQQQMLCQQSGDTLKIQFCEESIKFPSFGVNTDSSKDLVVTVPNNWICRALEIDAASATVQVCDLTIHEVDFDGASGVCVFDNCHVDTLDLDTASGDVSFNGTLDILECDAVSANFCGVLEQTPSQLDFDGVSGDLDLTLPEDSGFCVSLDSLSGNFTSNFPTTLSDGSHIHGDGSCRISADGVSGNITIRKGGYTGAEPTAPMEEAPLCSDPSCTDASHDHSAICTKNNCTDESHGHTYVESEKDTNQKHDHSDSHHN